MWCYNFMKQDCISISVCLDAKRNLWREHWLKVPYFVTNGGYGIDTIYIRIEPCINSWFQIFLSETKWIECITLSKNNIHGKQSSIFPSQEGKITASGHLWL